MEINKLFKRPGREDIFVIGERRLERLRAEGRYSCYRTTRAVLRKLSVFMAGKQLPVKDVTVSLLEEFQRFLALEMGNGHNTIVENMKVVLLLIEEAGIHMDLRKTLNLHREQTLRTYLYEAELEKLMALRVKKNSTEEAARDIFFVECRTGLRIGDLLQLKWSACVDGVIHLRMQKTQRPIEVPMSTQVQQVLDKYRTLFTSKNDYVFPLLASSTEEEEDTFALSKRVISATVRVNLQVKRLARRAGLGKTVSSHVGRHTFATMLLDKGASIYEIKEMLGHQDVKVTQIYAHIREDRKRALVQMLE